MKLITRFPHNYRQSPSLVSQCLQWNVWCTALQTPHAAAVYSTPVTSNTRSTDSCSLVPAYLPAFFFGVTHSSVSDSDSGLLGLWWEGTHAHNSHYQYISHMYVCTVHTVHSSHNTGTCCNNKSSILCIVCTVSVMWRSA